MGLLFSLLSTIAYGMLFNAPVRTLLACGMVGMLGWAILYTLPFYGAATTLATFSAAAFISLASQFLSIRMRVPSTNFSVAGIIPLVPGSIAYKSMLAIVREDYVMGVTLAVQTMLAAGAIAAGLIIGLSMFTVWKGFVSRYAGRRAKAN